MRIADNAALKADYEAALERISSAIAAESQALADANAQRNADFEAATQELLDEFLHKLHAAMYRLDQWIDAKAASIKRNHYYDSYSL